MSNAQFSSAIHIENLSKDYGTFKLENLSLDLPKGSIMGFVDQNGAGKTTTIKLILNQLKRDAGEITVLGMDNIECEMDVKKRIGVVLDEGFFYEALTPKEIGMVMEKIYPTWDNRLYYRYLSDFNLSEKKKTKELSRGMKMKLSLALALSHSPDLLILDEATSVLDPVVRNEILDIFLDYIQDEEHSILLSSHITTDLEKIADYIAFIHDGSLIFNRTKDDLLESCGILKCGVQDFERVDRDDVIGFRRGTFGVEALVENRRALKRKYDNMLIDPASLEDIMMLHMQSGDKLKGEVQNDR